MMKSIRKIILFLLVLAGVCAQAAEVKNLSVYSRQTLSLNGPWHYIVDPYENGYYNYRLVPFDQVDEPWSVGYYGDRKMEHPGDLIEYNFDKAPTLQVPGDWNTQDPKFYYYEGTIWYRRKFESPELENGERVYLYFGAVNYRADVYLNARKLGTHIGGFTPFWFDITDLLSEDENSLVVKVDNKRLREGVPTVNTDWWNYGGITRRVDLVIVPKSFVRDYHIGLDLTDNRKITGTVYLDNFKPDESVSISIPELKLHTNTLIDEKGMAHFSLACKKLEYWSPDNPKRYVIHFRTSSDQLTDTVAFRNIAVRGKELLLNDEPVFLRGISVHEEYAADGGGRVNSPEKAAKLLSWAKELGCNFVRLAHYPHNEDMVRIAERMGILVWSEIPVYWTIEWENEETFQNARRQLEENILRDRNRANLIIWSLSNETPVNSARTEFLKKLALVARELDGTRLLSSAMEKHYLNDSVAIVQDPLADIVDIVSFNEYIGWYDGLPEKCDRVSWKIVFDKPVFISEFGGGAKYGYHGEANMRWTEEFQADLYERSLKMLDSIDGLCGMSPWILADFRSPRRILPEIQDDFNRKGVLSEKGEKKKAFYILQHYYSRKAE